MSLKFGVQSWSFSEVIRISSLGSFERKIANVLFVSMNIELAVQAIVTRISRSSSSMQQTVIETLHEIGKMSLAPMSFVALPKMCVVHSV